MNKKIQTQIDQSIIANDQQKMTGSVGVILSYDYFANTATVLCSKTNTDELDELLNNVTCPTFMGIQMAAPEPGRLCHVVFRNGNITQPLITHYYNHRYSKYDHPRQSGSVNNLPSYLIG